MGPALRIQRQVRSRRKARTLMFRPSPRLLTSTPCSCKSLQVEFSAKTAEIRPTFQRRFLKWEYGSSNPPRSANQSGAWRLCPQEAEKCPPMAGFGESAISLRTPKPAAVGAKSPIVSGRYLKYSRFRETAAGDRVRSALRGRGGRPLSDKPLAMTSAPASPAEQHSTTGEQP
jgi:hypothetical protein